MRRLLLALEIIEMFKKSDAFPQHHSKVKFPPKHLYAPNVGERVKQWMKIIILQISIQSIDMLSAKNASVEDIYPSQIIMSTNCIQIRVFLGAGNRARTCASVYTSLLKPEKSSHTYRVPIIKSRPEPASMKRSAPGFLLLSYILILPVAVVRGCCHIYLCCCRFGLKCCQILRSCCHAWPRYCRPADSNWA